MSVLTLGPGYDGFASIFTQFSNQETPDDFLQQDANSPAFSDFFDVSGLTAVKNTASEGILSGGGYYAVVDGSGLAMAASGGTTFTDFVDHSSGTVSTIRIYQGGSVSGGVYSGGTLLGSLSVGATTSTLAIGTHAVELDGTNIPTSFAGVQSILNYSYTGPDFSVAQVKYLTDGSVTRTFTLPSNPLFQALNTYQSLAKMYEDFASSGDFIFDQLSTTQVVAHSTSNGLYAVFSGTGLGYKGGAEFDLSKLSGTITTVKLYEPGSYNSSTHVVSGTNTATLTIGANQLTLSAGAIQVIVDGQSLPTSWATWLQIYKSTYTGPGFPISSLKIVKDGVQAAQLTVSSSEIDLTVLGYKFAYTGSFPTLSWPVDGMPEWTATGLTVTKVSDQSTVFTVSGMSAPVSIFGNGGILNGVFDTVTSINASAVTGTLNEGFADYMGLKGFSIDGASFGKGGHVDQIVGGSGQDTLHVDYNRSDCRLTKSGSTVTLTDVYNNASTQLSGIENIEFRDQTVATSTVSGSVFTGLSSGGNALTGAATDDTFNMQTSSGSDVLAGGGGADYFNFAANFTANERIDGGAGVDALNLDGDYGTAVVFTATTMTNVEVINLAADHVYNLRLDDANTAAGSTLTVNGASAKAVIFTAPLEKDGFIDVVGSAGADFVNAGYYMFRFEGGAGNDQAYENWSPTTSMGNTIDGGTGKDTVAYGATRSNFIITQLGNGRVSVQTIGYWYSDYLTNVDVLKFIDQQVALTTVPTPDYNCDGNGDLLWQNTNGQAAIWELDGTNLLVATPVGSNPGTDWKVISGGDFNGDGYGDILWQNVNGQIALWELNGTNILYANPVGTNMGMAWRAIGSGDFDGDGNGDVLWQNANGQAEIWLMRGSTVLSMTPVGNNAGQDWRVIGAGDFNADGKADILWQSKSGQAGIWLMNGTTVITVPTVGSNPGASWHAIGTGDFNGDAKADILWQSDGGQVGIWLMNGTSIITAPTVGPTMGTNWKVKSASDINGDGKSDILWQNTNGQAGAWLMNGTNVLSQVTLGSNPGTAWQIANGGLGQSSASRVRSDFNADGKADVVWQNSSGQAGMWLLDGTAITTAVDVGSNPGPTWHVKGSGDFDGDGKADILWQNNSGQAGIWLMNGTTILSAVDVGANPGSTWKVIGSGDFDGDGKADILWQSTAGQAGIWFMNGTTVLSPTTTGNNPGSSWHVIGSGDFNGDGKADILWQSDSGQAGIWLMNGTTILSSPTVGSNPGPTWHVKGAGDFDGDGKSDILWQSDSGQAGIWFMDGTNVLSMTTTGNNPGSAWQVKGAADVNGDGKSDILWQNANGQAGVWLMNGNAPLSQPTLGNNPGSAWHLVSGPG